jgi:hypothetical protein
MKVILQLVEGRGNAAVIANLEVPALGSARNDLGQASLIIYEGNYYSYMGIFRGEKEGSEPVVRFQKSNPPLDVSSFPVVAP